MNEGIFHTNIKLFWNSPTLGENNRKHEIKEIQKKVTLFFGSFNN